MTEHGVNASQAINILPGKVLSSVLHSANELLLLGLWVEFIVVGLFPEFQIVY